MLRMARWASEPQLTHPRTGDQPPPTAPTISSLSPSSSVVLA